MGALLGACTSDSSDSSSGSEEATNNPPTVNAGENRSVQVNENIVLSGIANDSDGEIVTYEWREGNRVLATTASFDFLPTVAGEHNLTLTVTDDDGVMASDSIIVTATNEVSTLSNGLVAYYKFEGNAKDSSGNGNDGVEYGGVTYVDGMIGQAGSFDGVDDYIDVQNNSKLDDLKNTFTISAYILDKDIDDGIDDDRTLIGKGNVGHIAYNTFILKIDDDKKLFLWLGYGGDDYQEIKTNYIVPQNKFIFYVVVYNGYKIKVYANGKQVLSTDKTFSKSLTSNNGNIEIGRQSYDDSVGKWKSNWNGLIDDLRIYNRVLNEKEIAELYNMRNQ